MPRWWPDNSRKVDVWRDALERNMHSRDLSILPRTCWNRVRPPTQEHGGSEYCLRREPLRPPGRAS